MEVQLFLWRLNRNTTKYESYYSTHVHQDKGIQVGVRDFLFDLLRRSFLHPIDEFRF